MQQSLTAWVGYIFYQTKNRHALAVMLFVMLDNIVDHMVSLPAMDDSSVCLISFH